MILHFLTDDKFADYAIKQFSSPEMQSEFVCLNTEGALDLVKMRDSARVFRPYSREFASFLDDNLGKYTAIVLHGMHWGRWQKEIIRRTPKDVKIAWVLWGGDVYGRHDIAGSFIAPKTKFLCWVRKLNHRLFEPNKRESDWELPYELFRRVDYCLTSQDEEYNYAANYCKKPFKRLWYTYYSMEEMIGSLMDARCHGKNVWLGNSATSTNNHFDALWMLAKNKRKLGDRKIVMPLSYSEPWVANSVSKVARWLFGKNSQPLMKMLPRDEYNALMLDCSTMIMPHYMSQAMGNIYTGLWLGMRVYMSEKNISYHYLKRIGANVYTIEHDFAKYGFEPLADELVEQNIAALMKVYGREHVMEEIKNVVKELSTKK